jgi:tetratricopeptide (TPR) repeat protein
MSLSRAVVALLSLAVASPAFAQDWKGVGRLEGKVTDAQGAPIAGAIVKLELPGRGGTQLKTDAKGHWAYLGLAGGQWSLDFSAEGYATKRIAVPLNESDRVPLIATKLEQVKTEVTGAKELEQADAAFKDGRYADARVQYEKLLALRPDLASQSDIVKNLHWRIARCYNQEKDYAKELDELQKALAADPNDIDLKKLIVQEAFKPGLPFDRGVEIMKTVDDSTLQDPDVLYNIAVAFYNNQKVEEAVSYLTKAIGINAKYADGYLLRGNGYLNLGKIPEAKADYAKFIELAPDDPRAAVAKKALEQLK